MNEWFGLVHAAAHHPVARGAAVGVVTAAAVDIAAFRSWKSFDECRAYDWKVAAWRWFQGAVIGGMTGFGFGWV